MIAINNRINSIPVSPNIGETKYSYYVSYVFYDEGQRSPSFGSSWATTASPLSQNTIIEIQESLKTNNNLKKIPIILCIVPI